MQTHPIDAAAAALGATGGLARQDTDWQPPLVAISVARKARMHKHLQEGGRVGIRVLSESQEAVAMHFGGKPTPRLVPQVVWEHETPLIAESTATSVATSDRIHDGGDQRIYVAQLLQLQWRDAEPLLF